MPSDSTPLAPSKNLPNGFKSKVRIRFEGKIYPLKTDITIINHPIVGQVHRGLGLQLFFQIAVDKNTITIDCDLNKFDKAKHLNAVGAHATRIAKIAVDLASFKTGLSLFLIIEKFTDEKGHTLPLVNWNREVSQFATAFDFEHFDDIMKLVLAEPQLRFAMKDLTDALTLPDQSLLSCARAVDAIRVYFAPEKKKKQGWGMMNQSLQLAQSYTTNIMQSSFGPRHGDYSAMDGPQSREAMRRAWIIMNRFLEYLKRGKQPLPSSEFPC